MPCSTYSSLCAQGLFSVERAGSSIYPLVQLGWAVIVKAVYTICWPDLRSLCCGKPCALRRPWGGTQAIRDSPSVGLPTLKHVASPTSFSVCTSMGTVVLEVVAIWSSFYPAVAGNAVRETGRRKRKWERRGDMGVLIEIILFRELKIQRALEWDSEGKLLKERRGPVEMAQQLRALAAHLDPSTNNVAHNYL